jgi:hypothetical protein
MLIGVTFSFCSCPFSKQILALLARLHPIVFETWFLYQLPNFPARIQVVTRLYIGTQAQENAFDNDV